MASADAMFPVPFQLVAITHVTATADSCPSVSL